MNISHFFLSLLAIVNEMSPYILLGFFIAGILHAFVKPEMMAHHLSGKGFKPVIKAALLGIPLPLCSCGVLPTAVSLKRQGASQGATTSFLIATPQTGVDSIAATYSLLGLPFAIVRPIAALVGSVFGGMAVNTFCKDNPLEDKPTHCKSTTKAENNESFFRKLAIAIKYGFVDMVGSVGKWLVIGLIIAAIITVAVPDELFLGISQYPILAMLVMVLIAVPMYICATGSIPIALSLICKGLTPGVGFVLLMAGPAANFASVMILNKNLGKRTTMIYVMSVIVTAIFFGVLIDYILPTQWFIPNIKAFSPSCHVSFGWFQSICSAILLALLIYTFIKARKAEKLDKFNITMTKEYQIEGMACSHCQATVKKAIEALPGVNNVIVDLNNGKATIVDGEVSSDTIAAAVTQAGFTFKG